MEARCAGCKAMGSWRLAAYGSSGLEESAQDRDLEERHVICARASGTVASVRAGVASGPAAGGLRVRGLWSVPASPGLVPCSRCLVPFGVVLRKCLFVCERAATTLHRLQARGEGG